MSAPSDETPLASHDELVALESLSALLALYRDRGCSGDDEEVLERVQRDWRAVAAARAREVTEAPEALPAVTREREGRRYAIYGVIHGMVGGEDATYKAFVNATVGALEPVLFENGLSWFYPRRGAYADIPDFWVMGALGSLRMGLYVGLTFPLQLWTLLREALKIGGAPAEEGAPTFDFTPRYHAIDPETRRGLEEFPPLPSRLQVEYEMNAWDRAGFAAGWRHPFAIVPRSLFMAGFAVGYGESRAASEVSLVVGDLHTLEVAFFLSAPPQDHPLWRAGQAFGRRSDASRRVGARLRKGVHLGLAGVGGLIGLVPLIAALYALITLVRHQVH